MLTIEEVADHFDLQPDTVRRKVKSGEIHAIKMGRTYRLDWQDVWACENGPMPKGSRVDRYKEPLLSKQGVATPLSLSVRTIDRWIEQGLPTRNSFGAVRLNPHDVTDWLRAAMNTNLPAKWWVV
ncbi:excisionase family DNA-binding protein [Limimaricola variabilis]